MPAKPGHAPELGRKRHALTRTWEGMLASWRRWGGRGYFARRNSSATQPVLSIAPWSPFSTRTCQK